MDGTVGICRCFVIKADVFIFCRDILITNLDASMSYAELCDEVHEMCNLQQEQPITLKWIDDEGIGLKYFSGFTVHCGTEKGHWGTCINKYHTVGWFFFPKYITTEAWRNKTRDIRDDCSSTWIHFYRSTLLKPRPAELELNSERWKNTRLVWLIVVMVWFGFFNSSLSWWCCLSEWNFKVMTLEGGSW